MAVSTLLRRAYLPGRKIGGRLGCTGGSQVSRLVPPYGAGRAGVVVRRRKLDWARTYSRAPEWVQQLEVAVLPALSMANMRELLQAVLPLDQLSPDEATRLVIKHLVNRANSTRSRLNALRKRRRPT